MTQVADNVAVAVSGEASVAPTGTTAPTDSTTALNVAFTGLGWISEEGVTESYSDDVADIKGNDGTVLRTVITGSKAQLKFKLLETKSATLELYHKGMSVAAAGTEHKIVVKAPTADKRAFVLDVLDGATHTRIHVPDGEVSERGDIVYANGEAVGYEVTVTCYPDSGKVLLTKYSDSSAWT